MLYIFVTSVAYNRKPIKNFNESSKVGACNGFQRAGIHFCCNNRKIGLKRG